MDFDSFTTRSLKRAISQIEVFGSAGGEVVRATASNSRGPEFESSCTRAFFSSSINGLNQVPQERCIFAVFPLKTLAVLPEAKQV